MKAVAYIVLMSVIFISGCSGSVLDNQRTSSDYARYFDIIEAGTGDDVCRAVEIISPYNGKRDTLFLTEPFDNIVCMSSSQVAGLAAIGSTSSIKAVSGLKYISNPEVRSRGVGCCEADLIYDIGYESTLDFERILKLDPDVLLTYSVSGSEPPYVTRLKNLGVRVLVLHDHLENHPLARAEYIKLYGALTGRSSCADSLFESVCARYDSLTAKVDGRADKVKVLMNVPYGDAWYIPGGDSYMSCLINDAGGAVLGAKAGKTSSRIISLEEAYKLSKSADCWLNPGPCRSKDDMLAFHHSFRMFGPLEKDLPIYNNTLRMTPEGGNDFWESGSIRPDLVLEDLISIFSSSADPDSLKYHFKVE